MISTKVLIRTFPKWNFNGQRQNGKYPIPLLKEWDMQQKVYNHATIFPMFFRKAIKSWNPIIESGLTYKILAFIFVLILLSLL